MFQLQEARSHLAASMMQSVLDHPQVKESVNNATKAGVPFWQILTVIMPIIMSLFNGTPLNPQAMIASIIAAINALIHPVVPPVPVPPTPPAPVNP